MEIRVVRGVGTGKTTLSAFDNALKDAGVYNYNLIPLSSIIPPGTKVIRNGRYKSPEEEFGYKLYCVKAEIRSNRTGRYIAAGLGWYQLKDGRGLFVEHEVEAETKVAADSEIKSLIKNSLRDLCTFRKVDFDENNVRHQTAIVRVKGAPACVLVIATYQTEGWS